MAKVTDVRIRRTYDEGKVKAIISVTLDDAYVIHGIKILENENGYFIAMPSKKLKEGEFKDVFHPINSEARKLLQDEIISLYNNCSENKASEEVSENEALNGEFCSNSITDTEDLDNEIG